MKEFFQNVLVVFYIAMIFVTFFWFPLWMPESKTYGDLIVYVGVKSTLSILWPLAWFFKLLETPL